MVTLPRDSKVRRGDRCDTLFASVDHQFRRGKKAVHLISIVLTGPAQWNVAICQTNRSYVRVTSTLERVRWFSQALKVTYALMSVFPLSPRRRMCAYS
jgi:hypothetical protein